MEDERFTIMSSVLGRYTVFDEYEKKPLNSREVEQLLNKQERVINNIMGKIDGYLMEINYQIEQGTELNDTYVRYGRFKQVLIELKGELE